MGLMRAWIAGTGCYLPERVMTNEEVCASATDTSDEWIQSRLGIRERRIAAPNEQTSDLGAKAAIRAIEAAGLDPNEIDGIICAVGTGDVPVPATACYVQKKLGITNKGFAFDIKMACAGAVGGMTIARGMVESGIAKNVLVVCTYILSRTTLDWSDRRTAPIFGDGAGAVVMSASPDRDSGILASSLRADGALTDIVGQYVGGTREWYTPEALEQKKVKLEMDGRAVWDCAVEVLPEVIKEVVAKGGYQLEDVDFVVSHQANKRLLYHVMERAGIPLEKTFTNIEAYGNTSAASVFIALDEAARQKKFNRGDLIVMMAIGAGMNWGAHLIRW